MYSKIEVDGYTFLVREDEIGNYQTREAMDKLKQLGDWYQNKNTVCQEK